MRKTHYFFIFVLLISQLSLASTMEVIQRRIFTPQCGVCHYEGSSFAVQSGLLLSDEHTSYQQLVNMPPHNHSAEMDGLIRVSTRGDSMGLMESFLWHKIDASMQDNIYEHHPHYGEIMPLGLPYLTNGELDLLAGWIIAGAPQNETVVDTSVLEDTARYIPPPFEVPPPPDYGMQIHLGPFSVAPVYEREFFSYLPSERSEDVFINRVKIVMRPGSHHFILYTFPDGTPGFVIPSNSSYRDIRDANGNYIPQNMIAMAYHQFFAGTQWPRMDYHFPPGVALRLRSSKGLDLNSHYANYSADSITGEVYTNLYYEQPDEVQYIAEVLNLANTNFSLPPNQVTTITSTYTFNNTRSVFQLFTHAHQHMTQFDVQIYGGPRDGELVYRATDWQHPPILELDPPIVLETGQGFRAIATYDNWENHTITYGLQSTDEMMIVFGYYYPGVANEVPHHDPLPGEFALKQNFPNPFNPSTSIAFELPQTSQVKLSVFDISGRWVETLVDAKKEAGQYTATFDGSGLSSGLYFAKLTVGGFSQTQKMILLK